MEPSFVKCDKQKIYGEDWFEYLEKRFLLKIIPRGEGGNIHNEVAFLRKYSVTERFLVIVQLLRLN